RGTARRRAGGPRRAGVRAPRRRRGHGRAAQLPVPPARPGAHRAGVRDEPLPPAGRARRRRLDGPRRAARARGGSLLREAAPERLSTRAGAQAAPVLAASLVPLGEVPIAASTRGNSTLFSRCT